MFASSSAEVDTGLVDILGEDWGWRIRFKKSSRRHG